jgi:hydroxymethylpyrimidine/phosphomethylpyrimidine kinase
MKKTVVLSIGGSDSSGGAGIQADIKAFSLLDLHGATVITAITAQSADKVEKIYKVPVENIESQIDTIFEDMEPKAVKTGMLFDKEIIKLVSKKIAEHNIKTIVDPVMISTSGYRLSEKEQEFIDALKNYLLPKAFAVTPNIIEASKIANKDISSKIDVEDAAREIHSLGAKNVIIKGGHLKGDYATDFVFNGEKFISFYLPKIKNKKTHGSGCSFSAILTGLVAKNMDIVNATKKAKTMIWGMIEKGYNVGKGADIVELDKERLMQAMPPDSSINDRTRFYTWNELRKALEKMIDFLPLHVVPEVGINFGYALPKAKNVDEVCALTKRIRRNRGKIILDGRVDFCASKHIASIITTAMRTDESKRSAINIKYSPEVIDLCESLGFSIGSFDRREEPKHATSTMEWGVSEVIKKLGFVPDIIYDKGGIGKEAMIRIIGDNPKDVLDKLSKITSAIDL